MPSGYQSLTEKEKETLRLILFGHDAKSMAGELNLSVHTINERLRNARRKLAVTSSKEAARLLLEREGEAPEYRVHKRMGAAARPGRRAEGAALQAGNGPAWPIVGVFAMIATLALFAALVPLPALQADAPREAPQAATTTADAETRDAALAWLALVDAGDWQGSFDATAPVFQELNTVEMWRDASMQARVPLGAALEREAIAYDVLAAPPRGYRVVRFRTDFAAREGVVETVTLERHGGAYKVVGYLID